MTPHPLVKYNVPTAIVLLGGTGDLVQKNLVSSLFDLFCQETLPDSFSIIGVARTPLSDREYHSFICDILQKDRPDLSTDQIEKFCQQVKYVSGDFNDPDLYYHLKDSLKDFDESIGQCSNKLFYLAVAPEHHSIIFEQLHKSRAFELCDNINSWARLLVEKPFGSDFQTARLLEKQMCRLFKEEQIYRIDHYLAKDAIENIIALRFANGILADSWNGRAIESVHIKLLEANNVSRRGPFYDKLGTLRDVGQNHLLQIFALLTMPSSIDIHQPETIRKARAEALKTLARQKPTEIERGQYQGYTETEGVESDSQTETYFKFSVKMKSGHWKGTEFIFESGKALGQQLNEVVITFRPQDLCRCSHQDTSYRSRNILKIRFAPEQLICLSLWTKQPGFSFELREQELEIVSTKAEKCYSPEAYTRVIYDCIAGDQTRFVSGQENEYAWRFITPILDAFADVPLRKYKKGSSGPVPEN